MPSSLALGKGPWKRKYYVFRLLIRFRSSAQLGTDLAKYFSNKLKGGGVKEGIRLLNTKILSGVQRKRISRIVMPKEQKVLRRVTLEKQKSA